MVISFTNPSTLIAPSTGFTIATIAAHTYIDQLIYLSGIVAQDLDGRVVGLGDPEAQFKSIWDNITATLADADINATLANIVSTTTYVIGREYLEALEAERQARFPIQPPPSTVVIVAGLPNPFHMAAITVIAIVNLPSDIGFNANHHKHEDEETDETTDDTTSDSVPSSGVSSATVGDHGSHSHGSHSHDNHDHSYTHMHGRPTKPEP